MSIQSTQNRNVFVYNFLHNGLIFNLLVLLELSQSSLLFNAIMLLQSMQMKNMHLYTYDTMSLQLMKIEYIVCKI